MTSPVHDDWKPLEEKDAMIMIEQVKQWSQSSQPFSLHAAGFQIVANKYQQHELGTIKLGKYRRLNDLKVFPDTIEIDAEKQEFTFQVKGTITWTYKFYYQDNLWWADFSPYDKKIWLLQPLH